MLLCLVIILIGCFGISYLVLDDLYVKISLAIFLALGLCVTFLAFLTMSQQVISEGYHIIDIIRYCSFKGGVILLIFVSIFEANDLY